MGAQGAAKKYAHKLHWKVEIDGLTVAWFKTAGPFEAEAEVIESWEAGDVVVSDQTPGKVSFAPIEFSIGVTENRELYEWWLQVVDAEAGTGDVGDEFKKNLAVVLTDRDRVTEKMRFNVYRAWPSKYTGADGLEAGKSEQVVESMTLTHRYWKRVDA